MRALSCVIELSRLKRKGVVWTVLWLISQGALPAGTLEIEARGDLVTIHAQAVPFSRILDRLAKETGMAVISETKLPTQPVTASLERLPLAEALMKLAEGLDLGYAFRLDSTGRRVETVILMSPSAAGAAPQAPTAAPQAPTHPRPELMQLPAGTQFDPEMLDVSPDVLERLREQAGEAPEFDPSSIDRPSFPHALSNPVPPR